MACAACAEQVRLKIPQDNHAAFTRGLLFGVGGAIGGLRDSTRRATGAEEVSPAAGGVE